MIRIDQPTNDHRRKVRIFRDSVCVGSIWVSPSQDLSRQISRFMDRIGASIKVPRKFAASQPLPVELL